MEGAGNAKICTQSVCVTVHTSALYFNSLEILTQKKTYDYNMQLCHQWKHID